MLKVITLMKRHPDLSVSEFQAYWKNTHAPLVARLPGLEAYVQSHALPKGYARGELLFDGISEVWFQTADAYVQAMGSAAALDIWADQERFLQLDRKVVMPVDVHVIKNGEIPQGAVKNIEFVNKRPGMDLIRFRSHWKEIHGPIASRIGSVRRYEQNHLAMVDYESHLTPVYDGLAITWFDSTQAMKDGAKTEAYEITRADEPNFLPDGHLPIIITTEHKVV
jgi:uncharacterized protein (TIGR02118 family)